MQTAEAVWAGAGLAIPALFVLPWRPSARKRLVWLAVGFLTVQGLRFAAPLVEMLPSADAIPANPVATSLRQPIGEGRVLAIDTHQWGTLFGANDATGNGLESLRGYNPLIPNAARELLLEASGSRASGNRSGAVNVRIRNITNRAPLDLFNTQWIVSPRPLDVDGLTLRRTHGPGHPNGVAASDGIPPRSRRFVYENTLRMPRAGLVRRAALARDATAALRAIARSDPRERVFVEDERLVGEFPGSFESVPVVREGDRLTLEVDAEQGGYLVISELAHPGWRAEVDGREVNWSRANGYFLVLKLGEGVHEVALVYRPRSLQIGAAVTWVSLAGAIGLWFWRKA